jgi:hypothetical protein
LHKTMAKIMKNVIGVEQKQANAAIAGVIK